MPKRIIGVSERLLAHAKDEFLSKGFQHASLRDIAQKAGTSPRAIYTRFPDKEGLFAAIVGPAADGFLQLFQDFSSDFWDQRRASPASPVLSDNSVYVAFYFRLIDYAYAHKDEFTLILRCAEGTRYADFIEQLTVINCGYLEEYNGRRALPNAEATARLLHMLTHAFYAGLFEPLLHGMSREDAHFYVEKLCTFFVCGTQGLT